MKMAKAKWSFQSIDTIREDVKDALIAGIGTIMDSTMCDEIKLAMIDGMKTLFDALKPYMEETPDENIQND
jgi:hypothetical protein